MAENESLLDAFVRILPDPRYEQDMQNAIDKTKAMFGQLNQQTARAAAAASGAGGSGGGRGGGPQGDRLAEQYRAALRAAEDLRRETTRIGTLIRELDDENFAIQFELAKSELIELQVLMRRGRQDNDPLALRETLQRLDTVRERLQELSRVGSGERFVSRDIQAEFRSIVNAESVNRPNFGIENQLRRSALQGLDFKEKNRLNELSADVQRAQVHFDNLRRNFDATEDALERLINASRQLSITRDALADVTAQSGRTSRSFNTLSNNAYQIGQAFEDAAVGFSLNGFAGAVRGAANNVAFIINDMSRLESIQNRLPKGWAQQLPLIAGIGSALAITVLPKLIEWLESLNDIETRTKDITEELTRSFAETGFEMKIKLDEIGLARAVESAESVREILEKIRDLSEQSADKRTGLQGIFAGFQDTGALGKAKDSIREMIGLVTDQINISKQARERADFTPLSPDQVRIMESLGLKVKDFDEGFQETVRTSKEFAAALEQVEIAQANARKGIFDPEQLKLTEKLLFSIKDKALEFAKTADLADESFGKNFVANIEKIRVEFEKIRDESKEIASIMGEQLNIAVTGALRKTEELKARQEILRSVIKGTSDEQKLFLFDVNETSRAYQKLVDILVQSVREGGGTVNPQQEAALRGQGAAETELQILEEQRKSLDKKAEAEERIRDLIEQQNKARKSSNTELDAYARKLQTNALSNEENTVQTAIDKQLRIIFEETRRANVFNQAINDVRAGEDFRPQVNDTKFEQDFGKPQEIVEILNGIREVLLDNNKKTDETTNAVEHVMLIPRAQ